VVVPVVAVLLLLYPPRGMLKELKNAVSRGITIVAEAVIKPLIVRKNTGSHATKNVATFGLFPLYNAER
jgi:hypothetical protein